MATGQTPRSASFSNLDMNTRITMGLSSGKAKIYNGTIQPNTEQDNMKNESEDSEKYESELVPRIELPPDDYQTVQKELWSMKDQISQLSRDNYRLKKDMKFLDSKIALLITHKISIEEVEIQLENNSLTPTITTKDMYQNEYYNDLFLLLQTMPEYIAKLTRLVSQKEIDGLLQIVMFSLYGNQYENREEHLLLSMFEYALTYEVQEATEINSLMRANTAITRMMTTYCRRGPGDEYVRTTLDDVIQNLVAYNQPLEIDPLKIYQSMVDGGEIRKPEESNVLLHEAESNPAVQQRIQERVPVLQDFVLQILQRLQSTIDNVPYGIRWLCKATKVLVQEKFPEATSERVSSFIGGFFILRYVNPIIATPFAYRLLNNTPSKQSRRNLTLVAKLIQKLANTSSVRESYMLPLEQFVKEYNEQLKLFLSNLCDVSDFHEELQLEEYIALSRKDITIEITLSEVATLQSLLLKYRDEIVTSATDKLCCTLDRLPPPSDNMFKNQQPFKLKLSRRLADPGVPSKSPLISHNQSMNVADQLASARRKCKHLLIHLLKMSPSCMEQSTLQDALLVAHTSPMEEVVTHAEVISEQLKTIQDLGGLSGTDLFDEVKAILPSKEVLLQKCRKELASLHIVHETIAEHSEFLQEQLEAFRAYLEAVRAKVGEVPPSIFRKPRGVYKFTHSQLEKDGIIMEASGIPLQRRGNIYYSISCDEPGIYLIALHQKGNQKAIYQKQIHLEDLLEQQHLQNPTIDMDGLVLLNASKTLVLLSRYFLRRDQPRPISRHVSAPSVTLRSKT